MAIFSPLINLTVNFGIVLLLWLSRNQRSAEIGRLMASVNYMTQVLFSVTMISNALNAAVRAAASSRRIEEVLQETPAQRMPAAPQKPEIRGEIRFEHVSFSYAGAGRESLRDIDFPHPSWRNGGHYRADGFRKNHARQPGSPVL